MGERKDGWAQRRVQIDLRSVDRFKPLLGNTINGDRLIYASNRCSTNANHEHGFVVHDRQRTILLTGEPRDVTVPVNTGEQIKRFKKFLEKI